MPLHDEAGIRLDLFKIGYPKMKPGLRIGCIQMCGLGKGSDCQPRLPEGHVGFAER